MKKGVIDNSRKSINKGKTIAQHDNMTAINTVLQIDLTGQATAESLGNVEKDLVKEQIHM